MLKNNTLENTYDKVEWLSDNLPSITPILHPVRKNIDSNSKAGLWLLSAGKRNAENFFTYAKKVQDFDWADFYENYDGENYFNWMRKELKDFAEIILIDSRTGVTEMGGICTRQLSDSVILFTPPNTQNVSGISEMIKSLKSQHIEMIRGRPLDAIIIPSRIDVSELRDKNNFQSEFLSQIGNIVGEKNAARFWELKIPYIPYYTYHEELVAGASKLSSEGLKDSRKSADLEQAYLAIASLMLDDKFEPLPEKELINPYIGLRPFEESDSDFFYGRSLEISNIIDNVSDHKLLIIAGPTGSGKTSMLQAGVIPSIKIIRQKEKIRIIMLRPGHNIFYNMAVAMLKELGSQNELLNLNINPKELADSIERQDNKYTAALETFFTSINTTFLLIIDQLEEIFTLNYEKTIETFISTITRWRKANPAFSVILSIRSDFLQQLITQFSSANISVPPVINLGVLDQKELRQSIIEPAVKAGLSFEEGLVDRILKDSEKMFLKLPLIQNVLQELYDKRSGNIITHQAYTQLGQMDGLLQDIINKNLRKITPPELELARYVITRLIDVQTYRRRPIKLTDIDKVDFIKLKPFINVGLVAVNFNKQTATETIEFTSDFVFESWSVFNEWIKQDYEFLKWRQVLDNLLDDPKSNQEFAGYLIDSALLEQGQEWLNKYPEALTENEKRFIQKCNELKHNELRKIELEKKKRIIRLGSIIISIALVSFLVIMLLRMYNSSQNLKKFKQELYALDLKSGAEKQSGICDLSTFNNIYNSKYIRESKDSLLKLCLKVNTTINESQAIIDSTDSIIQSLSLEASKSEKITLQSNAIDSSELKLNNVKQRIKYEKNPSKKILLQKDSIRVSEFIDSIISTDTVLRSARRESRKIEQAISVQQQVLSKSNDAVYQKSSWFKKQYFLQFENIKVLLLNLSKSKQSINVEIRDIAVNKEPIATTQIELNQPFTFIYNEYKYIIQLDRIGSAGNNPFTPAAYITLIKYKNN